MVLDSEHVGPRIRSAGPAHAVTFLLALVGLNLALIAVALERYPAFFSQQGARKFVLESVAALTAYAIALVFLPRHVRLYRTAVWKIAAFFGGITGMMEIINVMLENGIPFVVHSPFFSVGFMLAVFICWGIAAFQTVRAVRSMPAGLLAAIASAGTCMLIAVAAGFVTELFLRPPDPSYVATWAEFKRSGWTDAQAFSIANTLDSGFTHLVIAPVVALIVGSLASLLAHFTRPRIWPRET